MVRPFHGDIFVCSDRQIWGDAMKNGIPQTNVFWSTPEGKPASFLAVDKLDWSETELAATQVFSIFDDGSGKPPV